MAESDLDKVAPVYAGAFTGFVFLTSVYLDHLGYVDLDGGGILAWILLLLMALPFLVFVGVKATADFLSSIGNGEIEPVSVVARPLRRSMRFAGGLLMVLVPGAFVVFSLIASK